jgi:hypothetical protein
VDEEVRHAFYKVHDIQSRPISVDLPGCDTTWQVRISITLPNEDLTERLLENPFYKHRSDALEAGLEWGRQIIDEEIKKHASS